MECPTCGKLLNTERGVRRHHKKVHDEPLPNRCCKGCGEDFYDPKSRLSFCEDCNPNAGKHNGNWKGAKEPTECERCGTEFEYYPSNKRGVYCSECVDAADGLLPENPAEPRTREEVPCEQCGASLERHPSYIEQAEYGVFCGTDCYGSWLSEHVVGEAHHQWEGGSIEYGAKWWRLRRRALERDNYECQHCGRSAEEIGRNPDVHHLDPVRSFDNPEDAHTLDNVIALCRSCHRQAEEGSIEPGKPVDEE